MEEEESSSSSSSFAANHHHPPPPPPPPPAPLVVISGEDGANDDGNDHPGLPTPPPATGADSDCCDRTAIEDALRRHDEATSSAISRLLETRRRVDAEIEAARRATVAARADLDSALAVTAVSSRRRCRGGRCRCRCRLRGGDGAGRRPRRFGDGGLGGGSDVDVVGGRSRKKKGGGGVVALLLPLLAVVAILLDGGSGSGWNGGGAGVGGGIVRIFDDADYFFSNLSSPSSSSLLSAAFISARRQLRLAGSGTITHPHPSSRRRRRHRPRKDPYPSSVVDWRVDDVDVMDPPAPYEADVAVTRDGPDRRRRLESGGDDRNHPPTAPSEVRGNFVGRLREMLAEGGGVGWGGRNRRLKHGGRRGRGLDLGGVDGRRGDDRRNHAAIRELQRGEGEGEGEDGVTSDLDVNASTSPPSREDEGFVGGEDPFNNTSSNSSDVVLPQFFPLDEAALAHCELQGGGMAILNMTINVSVASDATVSWKIYDSYGSTIVSGQVDDVTVETFTDPPDPPIDVAIVEACVPDPTTHCLTASVSGGVAGGLIVEVRDVVSAGDLHDVAEGGGRDEEDAGRETPQPIVSHVTEQWAGSHHVRLGPACRTECSGRPILAPVDEVEVEGSSTPSSGSGNSSLSSFPMVSEDDEADYQFDERAAEIIDVLTALSGSEVFTDGRSPEYRAACWLIHDDLRRLDATDPSLVQRYVLATLFHGIGGDGWEVDVGFLGPEDECTWGLETWWLTFGVGCDNETGDVTSIDFDAVSQLDSLPGGTIVSEISKLHHLETLLLSGNGLRGSIPRELFELRWLKTLSLGNNTLMSTIPEELGRATNLELLDLTGNYLTGLIPTSIESLTKLTQFSVYNNSLVGYVPEGIYDLTGLQYLDISANMLNGTISDMVGQLTNLTSLFFEGNFLYYTIPTEIGLATSLMSITLNDNRLSGTIPSEIAHLTDLYQLELSSNLLSGTIPPEITGLVSLSELGLQNNTLGGHIPFNIGNLSGLELLSLSDNHLTGEIPASFGELTNLTQFRLHNTSLTGTVPESLCNASFSSADCDDRYSRPEVSCPCCGQCYGPFSSKSPLGECADTEVVVSIDFTGGYYLEWEGLWWELRDMGTDAVLLQDGPYSVLQPPPSVFKTCVAVTNCLTFRAYEGKYGSYVDYLIDGFYSVLSRDASFSWSSGFFGYWDNATVNYGYAGRKHDTDRCDPVDVCGRIEPHGSRRRGVFDELVKLSGLERLSDTSSPHYRAACWLIDEDPQQRMATDVSLSQRYVLALFHFIYTYNTRTNDVSCGFSGFETASHECDWAGIRCSGQKLVTHIDLSNRGLCGGLLREVGSLPMLQVLDLSDNGLGSTIPLELANLWSLVELDLGNNNFHREIPSEIGEIDGLQSLILSSNKLSGTLPSELFQLRNLTRLDLSDNRLRGSIASQVGELSALEDLHLTTNFLTGSIPPDLTNATRLRELHLSENQFTGSIPSNIFEGPVLLSSIKLFSNRLQGIIPDGLSNMRMLKELMLHDNRLSGSISDEIGWLTHLTRVTLSHNSLRGTVPSSFSNLRLLSLLNIHGNSLSGRIPRVQGQQGFQFIADCGDPPNVDSRLVCPSCTVCCNVYNKCQEYVTPNLTLSQQTAIFMVGLLILLFSVAGIGMVLVKTKLMVFKSMSNARNLCGEASVYSFILTPNGVSWIVVTATLVVQILVFGLFLSAANFSSDDNDWQYSMRCPPNTIGCEDESDVTWVGWVIFGLLYFVNLAPDLVNGMRLLYKSAASISFRCLLSGTILVMVTGLGVWSSVLYNEAIAATNTALMTNAVILLFINDMDERVFAVLENMCPDWIDKRVEEAERFSLTLNSSSTAGNEENTDEDGTGKCVPYSAVDDEDDVDIQDGDATDLNGSNLEE